MTKRRAIAFLAMAEFLGMSVWFSASAVASVLAAIWKLGGAGQAWLTMSVQIGFVAGALVSSLLNLADRLSSRRMFAASSFLAAASTALIPALNAGPEISIFLRFMTGLFLAGVYPVGMKIMATWTKEDRGLGIGLLVGALTLGSAAPHLLKILGAADNWKIVLYLAAGLAASGGLISALFLREGPFSTPPPRFHWKYAVLIWREKDTALANIGYLGHMWELYAMWTWLPVFLAASFGASHIGPKWASLASFAAIGAGGIGSLVAGRIADRVGRTVITIFSLAVSGACALTIGLLFGRNPAALVFLCVVWGTTVVADSAQFSACVSELCVFEYSGTALTLQTSLGFLLTLAAIRLVPVMEQLLGWKWAFSFLALGPAVGIWAMVRLRKLPGSIKMAGGKR